MIRPDNSGKMQVPDPGVRPKVIANTAPAPHISIKPQNGRLALFTFFVGAWILQPKIGLFRQMRNDVTIILQPLR